MEYKGVIDFDHGVLDNGRVSGKQQYKVVFKEYYRGNKYYVQSKAHSQRYASYAAAAFKVTRTEVLGNEGGTGLGKGTHQTEGQKVEVLRSRHACNAVRTEAVDSGLDDHVGDGEQHTLHSCRNTDHYDLFQQVHIDMQVLQYQPELIFLGQKKIQYKSTADTVGQHGGKTYAYYMQMEHHNKQQVQKDVYDSCKGQGQERPGAVAFGAQDGRTEVVEHHGGHAAEIDAQIQSGQIYDLFGCAHKCQYRAGDEDSDYKKEKT